MIELAAKGSLLGELEDHLSRSPIIGARVVSRRTLQNALEAHLEGAISASELSEWANLLEQRDEVACETRFDHFIADLVFRLATPEINQQIDEDLCREMLTELANA
jgi:glutamine synthetase adenylyltransferase